VLTGTACLRWSFARHLYRTASGPTMLVLGACLTGLIVLGPRPADAQTQDSTQASSPSSSSAKWTRVRGYVLDRKTQDPLPGASVVFRSKEGTDTLRTRTDELGHFRTRIPPGSYEVVAHFTGYYRLRLRSFTARRGAFQVVSPKLMPNFEGSVRENESSDASASEAAE
jgi:hypothetical protein